MVDLVISTGSVRVSEKREERQVAGMGWKVDVGTVFVTATWSKHWYWNWLPQLHRKWCMKENPEMLFWVDMQVSFADHGDLYE